MNKLEHFARRFFWSIGYDVAKLHPDRSLRACLRSLFSRLKINCVLDVGAHCGEYGLMLREIGYKDHIVSFEPVASSFASLQKKCALDQKWSAHRIALGSHDSEKLINIDARGTSFNSFLTPFLRKIHRSETIDKQDEIDSDVNGKESVTVKRLDGILESCTEHITNPRIYLKMDTQGWDMEVINGATARIDNILALQSEMSIKPLYKQMPDYVESISHLNQLGFEISAIFPVARYPDHSLIEFDCVMLNTRKV